MILIKSGLTILMYLTILVTPNKRPEYLAPQEEQIERMELCQLEFSTTLSALEGQDHISFDCPCEVIAMDYKLYSRWGNLLYQTNSPESPFDMNVHARKDKGEGDFEIPAGTYFFAAVYTLLYEGNAKEIESNGTLTIIH